MFKCNYTFNITMNVSTEIESLLDVKSFDEIQNTIIQILSDCLTDENTVVTFEPFETICNVEIIE